MKRTNWVLLALVCMISSCAAPANPAAADESFDRIVVVGDIHGDFKNFASLLQDVGVTDTNGRWISGTDRLVQLGDVPDRGPDTLRAIRFLKELSRQAEQAGGRVHALIGNHESMNMQGDLRYVHPGEYAEFVDAQSQERRDQFYEEHVARIKNSKPEKKWPAFDDAYRRAWNEDIPLGFVEHRAAWAPTGELGQWVLANDIVVKLNGTLFVHGGLSVVPPFMSLSDINTRARTELADPENLSDKRLVNREDGPLWYRGLARLPESGSNQAAVERMLDYHDAQRIVVGHTPKLGTLLPRFNGRVIMADVGLSDHYGGAKAALVLEKGSAWLYQGGQRIELPVTAEARLRYLKRVAPLVPKPSRVERYLEDLGEASGMTERPNRAPREQSR